MKKERKGFKALYKGASIGGQSFKVGRIYTINPAEKKKDKNGNSIKFEIKNNVLGFHYCVDADETVYYYDVFDKDYEIYEILDMNPNDKNDGKTYVTDKIKIIRKINHRYKPTRPFNKSYFELIGISRVYVWDKMTYKPFDRMIESIVITNTIPSIRIMRRKRRIKRRRKR